MVNIPTARDVGYNNPRSGRIANSGPTPMVGAAMQDAGQSIVQASYSLLELAEREKIDVANDRSNAVSTSLTRFLADEEQRFLKAREESSESGIGFTRQFMEGHQQRANDFAKANFEGLTKDAQTGYLNNILSSGNSLFEKANSFENTTKSAYYERTTNTSLDTLRTQIRNNAGNFEDLKRRGLDAINSADRPEPWKAARRQQWEADAAESQYMWDFSQNPTQAVRKMRGQSGSVVDKIIAVESGGNPSAQNPNSSAGGLGQFIDSTWLAMIKKYRPDIAEGKSAKDIIALKRDGSLAREMTQHYVDENQAFLKNQGLQTTDGNTYLAHFLGPRGAAQVLKSDPSTPITSILGQDAVNANPLLKGKSAADLIAWADKKMGGAGVMSEYDAIPHERRDQLASWGEAQHSQQVTKDRATTKHHYDDLIATEPDTVRESVILDDPKLDNDDKAVLVNALRTAQKDSGAVNAMIGAMAKGDVSVNSFDNDQTKVADNAYDKLIARAEDADQRQAITSDFVGRTKYIPKTVQAAIRQGVASTDPATFANAMSAADAVERIAPISFGAFEGGSQARDKLAVFRHMVNDLGLGGEEAAKRILRMNDPTTKANREVLKPEVEKFAKDLKVSDVTAAFDPGLWASAPGAGLVPKHANALLAEYREIAEDKFYEYGGDARAAKAAALANLKSRWNISNVSGSPNLMRMPPELHYPPIGDSRDYLREDAMKTATDYAAKLGRKVENVAILATDKTRADIEAGGVKAGRPPRYSLFYQYTSGGQTQYDEVLGPPWAVDTATLQKYSDKAGERSIAERARKDAVNDVVRASRADAEKVLAADPSAPDWLKAMRATTILQQGAMDADDLRIKQKEDQQQAEPAPVDPNALPVTFGHAMNDAMWSDDAPN